MTNPKRPSAAVVARQIGLPRKITILGTDYKLNYVNEPAQTDSLGRQSHLGSIDWWTSTINIYIGDRSPDAIKKVIFHEIVHGVIMEFQVNEYAEVPEEIHERVVESIATGLYDTFKRNKLLSF